MMKIEKIWCKIWWKHEPHNQVLDLKMKTWATQSGLGFKDENMMNFAEIWMQTINHITKI